MSQNVIINKPIQFITNPNTNTNKNDKLTFNTNPSTLNYTSPKISTSTNSYTPNPSVLPSAANIGYQAPISSITASISSITLNNDKPRISTNTNANFTFDSSSFKPISYNNLTKINNDSFMDMNSNNNYGYSTTINNPIVSPASFNKF